MNETEQHWTPTDWLCAKCNVPLKAERITVAYLNNAYPVDLLTCPQCGQVFVPEDLALGKMADVERELEDK